MRLFSELPPDTRLIACVHDEVILGISAQRAEQQTLGKRSDEARDEPACGWCAD
jgi:hypothetical protein